jgi:hypothetical protein
MANDIMKKIVFIVAMVAATNIHAQELYVFTEPASNMAAKSIGVRVDNMLTNDNQLNRTVYYLSPEIMFGVSKHIMLHATGYFSNADKSFAANGAGVYLKYRFFSEDNVHDHFRMAAFAKAAFNNSIIKDEAITLGRDNSGYEAGVVATKLMKKVALSATTSFVHATDNGNQKINDKYSNALNYTFSAGKLMLPKRYTSYKQVNMNLMLEFLGQTNWQDGCSYIDAAPAVQFIFNSRMRLDLGYRFAVIKSLQRNTTQSGLLRFEYNFYNVFR